jgi:hypothetical protein
MLCIISFTLPLYVDSNFPPANFQLAKFSSTFQPGRNCSSRAFVDPLKATLWFLGNFRVIPVVDEVLGEHIATLSLILFKMIDPMWKFSFTEKNMRRLYYPDISGRF